MVDATGSGGVVGDGAAGLSELVVEADAGGEREQPGGDAGSEVAGGAGAVAFERQQILEGDEDRLDPLPDGRQVNVSVGLVFAGGSDDQAAQLADGLFELVSGVSLVADDRLATGERSGKQR